MEKRVQNSMIARAYYFIAVVIVAIPSMFYTGYIAHENRIFPLRPFVKRTLVELGVSERALAMLRNNKLPDIEVPSNKIDIDSAYYGFNGRIYDLPTPANYGGISKFGHGLIFVDGKGLVWYFKNGEFKSVSSKTIPNINGVKANGDGGVDDDFYDFVVKDIAILEGFIYASAVEYFSLENCVTLSLFRTKILNSSEDSMEFDDWNKVFTSAPCLQRNDDGTNLIMIETGGRIIGLSKTHILLSVGDFGQNGERGKIHAQDRTSHYGKTIRLDLSTFSPTVFTIGHRNPQGLLLTEDGTVFATEHGPQGGDELNVIIEGRNYGWPLVTFGTAYGKYVWPQDKSLKDHSGFEKPIHSWLPGIGISSLIEIGSDALPNWDGDILVSSLFKASLYRIELDGLSPIVVEQIYIGSRIRDIVNFGDGFALQTDQENQLIVLEPTP